MLFTVLATIIPSSTPRIELDQGIQTNVASIGFHPTYYLEKDPAHLEFVQSLQGVAERVGVFDFTPGRL